MISKITMKMGCTTNEINLLEAFDDLSTIGAASRKILAEPFRKALLEEARGYPYQPLPEVVGSGEHAVRQQVGLFRDFPEHSQFVFLKNCFQAWMDEQLKRFPEYPFEHAFRINSLELLKYEAGSIGITPHRDGFRFKNLICVFILGGRGRFFICSDRAGHDAREIDASPGQLILMKAPGFRGLQEQPFHFVTGIRDTRFVFGLRQTDL